MLSAFLWQAFVIYFVEASHRSFQEENFILISSGLLFAQGSHMGAISGLIGTCESLWGGAGQVIQQQ